MNHEALQEILHRRPFVPFQIRLSSGEAHDVRHPECAILTKSRIVIADPIFDRLAVCALMHVTSIGYLQEATSPPG